jgi:hypothetical protein
MNTKRYLLAVLAAATLAACTDRGPLNNSTVDGPSLRKDAKDRGELLRDVPVTGLIPGGGTFDGVLNITRFDVSGDNIVTTGVLAGTATVGGVATEVTQAFTGVPTAWSGKHSRCEIVNLDLGPLDLNLLGLQVDLAPVLLDVAGITGPGNLLGNLLCAVTGILDGGGLLSAVTDFLNRINDLLAVL